MSRQLYPTEMSDGAFVERDCRHVLRRLLLAAERTRMATRTSARFMARPSRTRERRGRAPRPARARPKAATARAGWSPPRRRRRRPRPSRRPPPRGRANASAGLASRASGSVGGEEPALVGHDRRQKAEIRKARPAEARRRLRDRLRPTGGATERRPRSRSRGMSRRAVRRSRSAARARGVPRCGPVGRNARSRPSVGDDERHDQDHQMRTSTSPPTPPAARPDRSPARELCRARPRMRRVKDIRSATCGTR